MEHNYTNGINIEELAGKTFPGKKNIGMAVKKATSNSVVECIQRIKIEAAKTRIEGGRKTIDEIMFDVGY